MVSGTIQVMLTGECARCLDPLTSHLEVDIQQLFVYPGNEIDEDDEDDEIGQLVDDYVDLEPVLRDAVVLALPLAPVCREDCPGLCPQCGARLADVEPGHRHDEVDPRWAALRVTVGIRPNANASTKTRRTSRAGSEAENVAQQHAQPPFPVEDRRSHAGGLQQPGLPAAEAAARRVPELRHLQPASGRHELISHRGTGVQMTDSSDALEQLERIAGVELDHDLLERALTHRSYAYENGGLPTNERLEFLGDSVLGVIVTETLYRRYPDLAEGQLAKLRAAVVNMRALADVSRTLGLGEFIRLGRGEESTGGRDKSSILADGLEALIGAVYIDGGLAGATGLVHRLFDDMIDDAARLGAGLDWKTSLQELTASQLLGVPYYEVTESGPDHEKTFEAGVRLGGTVFGTGSGRSKKEAEQQAAEEAWNRIRQAIEATLTAAEGSLDAASGSPADVRRRRTPRRGRLTPDRSGARTS